MSAESVILKNAQYIYREENLKNGFIPRFDACLIKLIAIGYS